MDGPRRRRRVMGDARRAATGIREGSRRSRVRGDAPRLLRFGRVQLVENGDAPADLVNPTTERLPELIRLYAPNLASTFIAQDDPVRGFADEMILTAERYAGANPETVNGSTIDLASQLFVSSASPG